MELNDVIKSMEAGQVKSASALEAAPSAQQTNLDAALEKVAGAVPVAVAAPVDAVAALMKTANDLAGTEKEAEIAHSALCGQAFADGAIAKFAAYDAQAQQAAPILKEAAPIAPFGAPSHLSDDDAVKAAAEQGYREAQNKIAADFKDGYDAALQQVHDTAASEFLKGAAEVEVMVEMAQRAQ